MRILVTGGAGFIGSNLVDALCARGDTVTVLDCFDDAYDPALKRRNLTGTSATVVEGDIRRLDDVAAAVARADAVVHLAARAGVRESLSQPLYYEEVNVRGTAVVLEAVRREAADRGAPVPVVFASSSSVYGSQGPGRFVEDAGADAPVSPYAATKRCGELLAHAAWAGWGVPVTCLRFFTVYGPRQRPAMAIAKFIRLARAGDPLPIFGDGSAVRDFTFVSDAVDAVLRSLDAPDGFRVLNIGSDAPVRLAALVDAIEQAVGRPVHRQHLPVQPGDVPHTHADIQRARTVLGWSPQVPLIEGLRRYLAWLDALGG
jgi:UDP-glucuronate 4-epimerase